MKKVNLETPFIKRQQEYLLNLDTFEKDAMFNILDQMELYETNKRVGQIGKTTTDIGNCSRNLGEQLINQENEKNKFQRLRTIDLSLNKLPSTSKQSELNIKRRLQSSVGSPGITPQMSQDQHILSLKIIQEEQQASVMQKEKSKITKRLMKRRGKRHKDIQNFLQEQKKELGEDLCLGVYNKGSTSYKPKSGFDDVFLNGEKQMERAFRRYLRKSNEDFQEVIKRGPVPPSKINLQYLHSLKDEKDPIKKMKMIQQHLDNQPQYYKMMKRGDDSSTDSMEEEIQAAKAKMIRPRDILHKKGQLSPVEQKILARMQKNKQSKPFELESVMGEPDKKNLGSSCTLSEFKQLEGSPFQSMNAMSKNKGDGLPKVDSMVESAFGSCLDTDWERHRLLLNTSNTLTSHQSIGSDQFKYWAHPDRRKEHDPCVSVQSSDGINLKDEFISASNQQKTNVSVHDTFETAWPDDGSDLSESSDASQSHCSHSDKRQRETLPKRERLDKLHQFTYFINLNGLQLPTLAGDVDGNKFKVEDIIKLSQEQIEKFKQAKGKKLSEATLEQIVKIYQREMNAGPFNMVARMGDMHTLIMKGYSMSERQLDSIAVCLPYFVSTRYVNLENTMMKDQQAARVILACQSLKINVLILGGGNELKGNFVKNMVHPNLHQRVQELNISELSQGSNLFIALMLEKLLAYQNLECLNLRGNKLTVEAARRLVNLITSDNCKIENLNLSGCIFGKQQTKIILKGLINNESIKYLNISCNCLQAQKQDGGSMIGRLVQVHPKLVHLDVRYCQLIESEILFIVSCLRESYTITSIHLGFNHITESTRYYARVILDAVLKHPFKAQIQAFEQLGKNTLLVLNAFVMQALPEDKRIDQVLQLAETKGINFKKPAKNVQDIVAICNDILNQREQEKNLTVTQKYSTQAQDASPSLSTKMERQTDLLGIDGEEQKKLREEKKRREANFMLTNLQCKFKKSVYDEQFQKYFAKDPSERPYQLINFLDIYGRKLRLNHIEPPVQDPKQKELVEAATKICEDISKKTSNQRSVPKKIPPKIQKKLFNQSMQQEFPYQQVNDDKFVFFKQAIGADEEYHDSDENKERIPVVMGEAKQFVHTQGCYTCKKPTKYDEMGREVDYDAFNEFMNILQQKRALQEWKDFNYITQTEGGLDHSQQEQLGLLLSWGSVLNQLEYLLCNDNASGVTVKQRIWQHDLVFQRTLEGDQANKWKEYAECMVCEGHRRVELSVSETKIAKDEEFKQVLQLSKLVDFSLDANYDASLRHSMIPVFEEVYEEIKVDPATPSPRKTSNLRIPSLMDEKEEESAIRKLKTINMMQADHNSPPESINNADKINEKYELEYKAASSKSSSSTSIDQKQPFNKIGNSFDFTKQHLGKELIPISNQNRESLQASAMDQDISMFHSAIQAQPIKVEDIQKNVMEQDVESVKKIVDKPNELKCQNINGVIYRNMDMRTDLINFSDSSEDDDYETQLLVKADSEDRKVQEQAENPIMKRAPPGFKFNVPKRNQTVMARPVIFSNQEESQMDEDVQDFRITSAIHAKRRSAVPMVANQSLYNTQDGVRGVSNQVSKGQIEPVIMMTTSGIPSEYNQTTQISQHGTMITRTSTAHQNRRIQTALTRPETMGTNLRPETANETYDRKLRMDLPSTKKTDFEFSNLAEKIQIYSTEKLIQEQTQKTIKLQMEEKQKELDKNKFIYTDQVPQQPALDVLAKHLRVQWHKLRAQKKNGTMYLVASFNHWFPVEMVYRDGLTTFGTNSSMVRNSAEVIKVNDQKKEGDTSPAKESMQFELNLDVKKNASALQHTSGHHHDHHHHIPTDSSVRHHSHGSDSEDSHDHGHHHHHEHKKRTAADKEKVHIQKKQKILKKRIDKMLKNNISHMFDTASKSSKESRAEQKQAKKILKQPNKGYEFKSQKTVKQYLDQKFVKRMTDKKDDFKFVDWVPPGDHYFYFVKDGTIFCLSEDYEKELYPDSNIQMNKIHVRPYVDNRRAIVNVQD